MRSALITLKNGDVMETGELVLGIQKTEFAASTGSPVHPLSVWKFHC